jgi:hypothetical protein
VTIDFAVVDDNVGIVYTSDADVQKTVGRGRFGRERNGVFF